MKFCRLLKTEWWLEALWVETQELHGITSLTTTKPTQTVTDYTKLVWFDEFNTDGAPDATKWLMT
jgi:hypothetical protein